MALRDFLAVINHVDLARSNRYVVEIQPPNIPGLGIKPQQQINLMCQSVDFPGQNMRTATDDLRQGPTRDIAQAVTYGNTNMTFLCTPGLPEKLFFEAWQKLMFNHITWQAKFYRDYIGQIKLRELDRTDMVRYGIILYEAYPKIINAQDYSNTAADTMQTLQVEFAFHHWAMDTEVYDGTKRFGSEGGSDQEKPKRTVLAGTENMTVAEAQAFIRGETLNTLGQTYSEAIGLAAGGSALGKSAAGLLTGAGSSLGYWKGFQQSVGTMPMTSKGGVGLAVDAELVPAQKKINDGVKTTKPLTGYAAYKAKVDAEGEVSTLMCKPRVKKKQSAVATLPNQATISADAHPAQNAQGLITSGTFGRLQALAGKLAKPPVKVQSGPRGVMKTVQTDPNYILKELQAALGGGGGDTSSWINPNTGKRAVAGGTKAGGNLFGGLAAGLGMLTGGYKGAVSSGASGVMQQALGGASVSARVGGLKISAAISLGGGGGASSLIANKSGIGIGIPRFGGIPAVRGAGFQVRSVGYNRPSRSRSGRANHNAEGGGAAEAGVGD